MREIYTDYLNVMGTSEAQLARAEQMPALREKCAAHEGYLFTVDAYVSDDIAGEIKAVVDRVRASFDEKYTPLFKHISFYENSVHIEKNLTQRFIAGKEAEIRNYETVCKAKIDGLYDTCLKKIIRFVMRLFGCTLYSAAVNKIEEEIRPQTAALTLEINKKRKESEAKIGRFQVAVQEALDSMRKLALSYDEKRVLAIATPAIFRRTAEQLAFVAKPVDEHRESEAGGNTKASIVKFLRSVETNFRKKMHFRHISGEAIYRQAFEEQAVNNDMELVYRRMTNDELGARVEAGKAKGAIAPPPPPPVRKPRERSHSEQARWDQACAESHGDFSHSSY